MYLKDYDLIFDELPDLISKHNWNSILLGKKIAYSGGASYAIYNTIPSDKVTFEASPVMLMKAKKNKVSNILIMFSPPKGVYSIIHLNMFYNCNTISYICPIFCVNGITG